ncbi:MAG: sensor histidine kinase [Streptosporangiaceae bacterium]
MGILVTVMWRVIARLVRYLGRGVFLVPVAAIGMALFGLRLWTVAAVLLALVVAVWRPVVAAAALPVTMVVAGISGLVVAATEPGPAANWMVTAIGAFKQRVVVGRGLRKLGPPRTVKGTVVRGHAVAGVQVKLPAALAQVRPPAALAHVRPPAALAHVRPSAAFTQTVKVPPVLRFFGGPAQSAVQVKAGPGWTMVQGAGGPGFRIHGTGGDGHWSGGLLVPLALLLLTLGLWLLPRTVAALRTHTAGLLSYLRLRMLENRWGILLIPVALLGLTVFGVQPWTVALVLASVVTAARWPVIAADLIPVLLTAFAVRGFVIAASWQSLPPGLERPGLLFGTVLVGSRETAMLAGAEASAFLVVAAWLVPRTIGAHARGILVPGRDLELEGRVQRLTETRDLVVDHAATELRRIERDLHDGAQARLIALGMNLRAVERMLPARPDAALALVAEARETSLRALSDLRDLVRGICPPVLADRGLGHAVRALALDTPFPVDLDIDLPGRLSTPVESACYFAVAEALANAVRHSGARRVHIRMQHTAGLLRVQVADDGAGGADPARGSGLRGVEQRLGAFDGILAVSSPPGGPTMIAMEVPCALSSPKTCSC